MGEQAASYVGLARARSAAPGFFEAAGQAVENNRPGGLREDAGLVFRFVETEVAVGGQRAPIDFIPGRAGAGGAAQSERRETAGGDGAVALNQSAGAAVLADGEIDDAESAVGHVNVAIRASAD